MEGIANFSPVTIRRALYRLPLNCDDIRQQLTRAYKAEVARRKYEQDKTQETPEIAKMLDRVAQWLHTPTPKPFLILMGNVGNGKTTTAFAVATLYSTLSEQAKAKLKNRGMLSDYEKWLWDRLEIAPIWEITTTQEVVLSSTNPTKYATLKTAPYLILDELGVEPMNIKVFGTEVTPIADLLLYRYEKMLPTILTTNLNANEIGERYGPRIYDRLKEVGEVLWYNGASFR